MRADRACHPADRNCVYCVALQHKGNVRMPNHMRDPGAPTPMSEQLVRQAVCKAGDGEYTTVSSGCCRADGRPLLRTVVIFTEA